MRGVRMSPTMSNVSIGLGFRTLTSPSLVSVSIFDLLHDREYFVCCFTAVFCPEEEVPKFKEGTVAGTTNYLELKSADPKYWNKYKSRITYTCPVGYVIEKPGNRYNEQPDPIPEELETFEVECAANAAWTPRPKDGGTYMPYCIRK